MEVANPRLRGATRECPGDPGTQVSHSQPLPLPLRRLENLPLLKLNLIGLIKFFCTSWGFLGIFEPSWGAFGVLYYKT